MSAKACRHGSPMNARSEVNGHVTVMYQDGCVAGPAGTQAVGEKTFTAEEVASLIEMIAAQVKVAGEASAAMLRTLPSSMYTADMLIGLFTDIAAKQASDLMDVAAAVRKGK